MSTNNGSITKGDPKGCIHNIDNERNEYKKLNKKLKSTYKIIGKKIIGPLKHCL